MARQDPVVQRKDGFYEVTSLPYTHAKAEKLAPDLQTALSGLGVTTVESAISDDTRFIIRSNSELDTAVLSTKIAQFIEQHP